jgi:CRISPR/Cas system-associated exonuclease Cas4 (RecB family)
MITSASYTRITDFESCPLKAKFKYFDKIPDPNPRTAADRGTAIHLEAEEYVKGGKALSPFLEKFRPDLTALQEHHRAGRVSLEGEWGFDKEWQPTDWRSAWMRIKADAVCTITPQHAVVIDYKTGRKFGNEIKHSEQLQLYSLAAFLRNPHLEEVTSELWYTDQDELTRLNMTRQQALTKYLKYYDRRARNMTEAKKFPATPSRLACQYCPYKAEPNGTGHCLEGV